MSTVAGAAGACTSGSPGAPDAHVSAFVGDPSRPPDFTFIALDGMGGEVELHEGSPLALVEPPQGGRVAFVGVRATNVHVDDLTLTGGLRDEATRQVRFDRRMVSLRALDGGVATTTLGTGVATNLANFANVPLCPNAWASTDVFDQPFQLEITLVDSPDTSRQVTKTIHVRPACAEPDKLADCLCICKKGYKLGESCDAGAAPP